MSLMSKSLFTLTLFLGFACKSTTTENQSETLATSTDRSAAGVCKGGTPDESELKQTYKMIYEYKLLVRMGEVRPAGAPKADILWLNGFADRLDNHMPLFRQWRDAGFRVISFDYPSHGLTAGSGNDLNKFGFDDLGKIAHKVEELTMEDRNRPLILAGWSTGGLLTVRMIQARSAQAYTRPVKGVVLLAPGVSVHTLVGDWGTVTMSSLTSNTNPECYGDIKPQSPLHKKWFATKLVTNATLSSLQNYPVNIPTLMFVAGKDTDKYVKSAKLLGWIDSQRGVTGTRISGVYCPGSYHWMDQEPADIGKQVRENIVRYSNHILGEQSSWFMSGPCSQY